MCPIDPTPHGEEILHDKHQQVFPPPSTVESPAKTELDAEDIRLRPSLPTHVPLMTADIEDEDEDPVCDTGPGIDN